MTVALSWRLIDGFPQFLKRRGYSVRCVSSQGQELASLAASGIETRAIEMERRVAPAADGKALVALWWTLVRRRPSIVHAGTPKGGLLGMIAAIAAGVPVRVYTIHGLPFVTARGVRRLILKSTERIACRLASQVLCVSESVRTVAVAERICSEDRIRVLASGSANGVDARNRFNPDRLGPDARRRARCRLGLPEDALVIGFIGRLVREKGIQELVAAWRILQNESPRVRLLVIGPEESHDPLDSATIDALAADPGICRTGAQWDTPPLLAAMDVLCLPSYREGFPTVLLEAAAMELPVVATRIPGCLDAVQEGTTGALAPPRDPSALAAALKRYLMSAELRRRHGQAARRRVLAAFESEAIWEAQLQQYEALLGGQSIRRAMTVPERLALQPGDAGRPRG